MKQIRKGGNIMNKYYVQFWDDEKDHEVRGLTVLAEDEGDVEDKAAEILDAEDKAWIYEEYPVLVELIETNVGDSND